MNTGAKMIMVAVMNPATWYSGPAILSQPCFWYYILKAPLWADRYNIIAYKGRRFDELAHI